MNARKVLRIALCFIFITVLVLSMASCDVKGALENVADGDFKGAWGSLIGQHEHAYTASVTVPTCKTKGFTTYTCECGDTYVDDYVDEVHNYVTHNGKAPTCTEQGRKEYRVCISCGHTDGYEVLPAAGHVYEEKVTRFPTTVTTGVMSKLCTVCGIHEDTEIEAVTFTMPGISEILYDFIGKNSAVLDAKDNEIILITEFSSDKETTYEKEFVAIEVAYVEISGEGEELYANIHFVVGTAGFDSLDEDAEPTFESSFELLILVNGEDVSLSTIEDGEEYNEEHQLTEVLCNLFGVNKSVVEEIVYIGNKLSESLPLVEALMLLIGETEMPEVNVSVSDKLVVKDGDGYKLDISAIAKELNALKGKTVASLIDEAYGEGTVDKLEELALSIPELKIRDLADYAISFSEKYDVSLDETYSLINFIVYFGFGQEINIESEIITRYDDTLIEVLAELSEADVNEVEKGFTESIEEIFVKIRELDVDGFINLVSYGDPDYVGEDGEIVSSIDSIASFFEALGECINASWSYDGDGNICHLALDICDLIPATIQMVYDANEDGASFVLDILFEGGSVNLSVSSDKDDPLSATLNVYGADELLVFNGVLDYTEDASTGKTLEFKGYMDDELVGLISINALETEEGVRLTYKVENLSITSRDYVYVETEENYEDYIPIEYDGSEVTVTFYHTLGMSLQEVLEKHIEEFNELYPNITIDHQQVGGYDEVFDTTSIELMYGNQPNIVFSYPHHVASYRNTNMVVSLDNFIYNGSFGFTDEERAAFIEGFYNEGMMFGNDRMYTLPFAKVTDVLYYNKTFFEDNQLSVPTTWEEMEAVCRRILEIVNDPDSPYYNPDCIPLGYDSESNWFITMTQQYNSPYTTSSYGGDHYLFDNDINQTFVKEFRSWYEEGLVTTQEIYGTYTSDLFNRCGVYMSIGSVAGASHYSPDSYYGEEAFEIGVAPIPQVDPYNPVSIFQGPSLCILGSLDDQEVIASWLFVKFLTTNADFQAEYSMASGYIPVINTVTDNAEYMEWLQNGGEEKDLRALAVGVALSQEYTYKALPAFDGCQNARDAVGRIMYYCMITPTTDVDAMVDEEFKSAVENCFNYY